MGSSLAGAFFVGTNLQGTSLDSTVLHGSHLRLAKNLTATQLLDAIIDDTTLLDDELRAEYDRLKAEQESKS